MSTEFILLLSIYAFVMIGVFLGENGPIATFRHSAPRLAGKIERDISIGYQFSKRENPGKRLPGWIK